MKVIYVPEPLRAPVSMLYISDEDIPLAYLDEDLRPVKCYAPDKTSTRCPEEFKLEPSETVVVGGASGEVIASYLNARYVDERVVKMSKTYVPGKTESIIEAVREALEGHYREPVVEESILAVLPGNLLRRRSWGAALIAKPANLKPELVAEILFDNNFRTLEERVVNLEELRRFDYWWQPPWENVFAHGKSMRRLIELISERPVEKIPKSILPKEVSDVSLLVESLASYASEHEFDISGRRSLRKVVVYIDENLIRPSRGFIGVVVIKNAQRKVFARWYFDEKFQLKGFDNAPPEAVTGIDAEVAVGRVPREVQVRLSEALAAYLVKTALYAPVRIVDYLAVKVHRWYEIAAV
ncbi:hypothetical protein IG193_07180 [Infirmifilum lucidum]|uniref:Uncharacterized protein n=1 Tax=Infirmifilum lucidum TaxID=2776706 RepID=A0A7L9FFZ2_9CREN|nr:hypothetical protein [Infirmifilum lucidum]QOJ78531.1 hypothetical protein IG193_07180 [Infirmifilum lucidum]